MSNTLRDAYREKIERDVTLIEMLSLDIRSGLTREKTIPLKKYAQCISTIADSMHDALNMYEGLRNEDVS